MNTAADRHIPVLLDTCLDLMEVGVLAAQGAGRTPTILDATLGMGGHAEAALRRFPDAVLVGIDRDTQALELASGRLAPFGDRFRPVHAVYDEIDEALAAADTASFDAELYDLGVSSLQLDEDERGFAYSRPAPLDMRMNGGPGGDELTAAAVLNTYPEAEIRRILHEYGEERQAARIARAIVADRQLRPWETSEQLAGMLQRVIGATSGTHPAKRTFQALRIEVNRELEVLEDAIPAGLRALAAGGVQVVMSYHSLEDRIVKRAHARGLTSQAPPDMPIVPTELTPWLGALVRGAGKATDEETQANPRAASVRLRAVKRTRLDGKEAT